jgi:hypothetical protein
LARRFILFDRCIMVERSLRRHFDFPFEATPPAKFVPARANTPAQIV